tara:strand:+ start:2022 stop:2501 length:480 start_codon:yes stop_codon:yes gene_type:complete
MFRLLIILAALSPSLAWAGHGEENKSADPSKPQYEGRELEIRKHDLNEDGVLQLEERRSVMMKKFEEADRNQDSQISYDETRDTVSRFEEKGDHFGKWVDHHGVHLGKKIKAVDLDKDGMVSQAEYLSYFSAHFERMDHNEDEQITVKEYMQHTSRLNK